MITLRECQKAPTRTAIRYFRSNSDVPSLIVLPTGFGKSILTAFVAKYINPSDKLLVVQPTKELLEQNYNKYNILCEGEEPAGIYSASFGKKDIKRITYATIGSIKSIGKEFKELGFTKMLIDEAHLYPRKEQSMLGQFLADSGIKQVLGITATPLKLEQFSEKQNDKFDKWSELTMLTNPSMDGTFFKQILYVGQIQEVIQQGYWSPLIYERIPFDVSQLKLNTSGSEFSEDAAMQSYILNNIRSNIYAALDYHSERKHCLVFVPSVEEAQILAQDYPGAAYITGDMNKKERARIIEEFRKGNIRVILNVGVLAVGFDYPEIDLILLAISTASVAKYYQILGRGVRIHPDKKNCLIIDMGGNVDRFGKIEDIYFELTDRWRMYGTGSTLLTGLPMQCVRSITRQDVVRAYEYNHEVCPTFGKYKDKRAQDIPMSYKSWYMSSCGQKYQPLIDTFFKSIENYIRDTRNDPIMDTMPSGKYAGMHMSMVPKNHLVWFYNSQEWNEYNDSLRRGIIFFYGGIPPYISTTTVKKPSSKKTQPQT